MAVSNQAATAAQLVNCSPSPARAMQACDWRAVLGPQSCAASCWGYHGVRHTSVGWLAAAHMLDVLLSSEAPARAGTPQPATHRFAEAAAQLLQLLCICPHGLHTHTGTHSSLSGLTEEPSTENASALCSHRAAMCRSTCSWQHVLLLCHTVSYSSHCAC